jgi:hypothetical protein
LLGGGTATSFKCLGLFGEVSSTYGIIIMYTVLQCVSVHNYITKYNLPDITNFCTVCTFVTVNITEWFITNL